MHIYHMLTESFGFAVRKFDVCARLGWLVFLLLLLAAFAFPYLALSVLSGDVVTMQDIGYARANKTLMDDFTDLFAQKPVTLVSLYVAYVVVIGSLCASYFVPLQRFAGRGIPPVDASFSLALGWRHLKFMMSLFVCAAGLGIITLLPLTFALDHVAENIDKVVTHTYALFPNSRSLHTIELVQEEATRWQFTSAVWAAIIVFGLPFVYLSLRLFPLPVFVALREEDDQYHSLPAAWQVTRGWNVLKLCLAGLMIALILYCLSLILNTVILPLIGVTLSSLFHVVWSTTRMLATDGTFADWVIPLFRWIWVCIQTIANMVYWVFQQGVIAGFGGAIFSQSGLVER